MIPKDPMILLSYVNTQLRDSRSEALYLPRTEQGISVG